MSSPVNRFVVLAMAFAVGAAPAAAERSGALRHKEAQSWTWGVAVSGGFLIQTHSGATLPEAQIQSFTPGTKPPEPLREPVDGSYDHFPPYVGVSLELLTPELGLVPGRPRLFAVAEYLPTFSTVGNIAGEGAATDFIIPPRGEPHEYAQEQISGVGSRLTSELRSTVLTASLGAAFPFEFRGRLFRLKPSASWIRFGVRRDGRLLAAFKNDPVPFPIVAPYWGYDTRFVEMTGLASGVFNAVGPGLALEMELGKFGPVRPSLYLEGSAYRVLGERTIRYQDTEQFDDALGQATYTTTWTVEIPPWMYRAGLGFRVRWIGR